jgi:hypothetical protein
MNNAAKFIITALVIVAGIFMFKTYQSGGFENISADTSTQEVNVEH